MQVARAVVIVGAALICTGTAVGAPAVSPSIFTSLFSHQVQAEVRLLVIGPLLPEARLLVSGPIGNGFFAHVWNAPSVSGGDCRFVTLDHRAAAPQHPSFVNGGMSCSLGPQRRLLTSIAARHPLMYGMSVSTRPRSGRPRNWVPPYLYGEVVSMSLHASRIGVTWHGGTHDLVLQGRYFVGGTSAMYHHAPPYALVAYDATGREVARSSSP